tara:strand:+ start:1056 stop:1352 length:297 start_codon:yes stop_codon:yes gene_type:complete
MMMMMMGKNPKTQSKKNARSRSRRFVVRGLHSNVLVVFRETRRRRFFLSHHRRPKQQKCEGIKYTAHLISCFRSFVQQFFFFFCVKVFFRVKFWTFFF